MTDPNTGRPLEGCPVRPLSDDLTCIYPAGHDTLHRNFQGIEWRDPEAEPSWGRHAALCGAVHGEATCDLPAGHAASHRQGRHGPVWDRDPKWDLGPALPPGGWRIGITATTRQAEAEALLAAVETVKAGVPDENGDMPAVEIAGVRIEPCNEYGQTTTTRQLGRTSQAFREQRDKANAQAERLQQLEAELDEERTEHRATATRHAAAVEYAETLERRIRHARVQLDGDEPADAEPDVCGDTIGPVPKLNGAVMTCTLPADHVSEHYDGNASWSDPAAALRCGVTLDVDYGDQGQTLTCQLIGHHEQHVANDGDTQYRWDAR